MPTRYLKPGIRDSEPIDRLSPLAEVLFYRLIVTVDDFGRTDGRASMVKAACFPIRDSVTAATCDVLLRELAAAGLVDLYSVDGKPFLALRKWDNAPRAKESKYPAPADGCMHLHASADGPRADADDVHTDARSPRTVLPVTETETETGTDNRKPDADASPRVRAVTVPDLVADGLTAETAAEFLAHRKRRRANLTPRAWEGIKREAVAARITPEQAARKCMERGWTGFEAAWLTQQQQPGFGFGGPTPEQADAKAAAVVDKTADYLAEQQRHAQAAQSPEARAAARAALERLGRKVSA